MQTASASEDPSSGSAENSRSNEASVSQSVAHDGVCLTVVEVDGDCYTVTAVEETLLRTQLGDRTVGDVLNLERCTKVGDRLDGHIVQGHVDTTATVTAIDAISPDAPGVAVDARDGSWNVHFAHPEADHHLTVQKGSITVNGVSLTVVDSDPSGFSVTIIPYTWEHTGFHRMAVGDRVNLEFDIVGKYVAEMMARRS